jgi:MtrB/PioB family decaheme-associated outer membrane protein
MSTRNALGAIALATTCLAPLAAFAQNSAPVVGGTPFAGEIGIGVMGVMGNNPDQAGRYSGVNTDGIDIIGNFDLSGRSPWDSGGTRYYELVGNNLVFQTGNKLGSGLSSDGGYDSSVSNSLMNAGSVGFKAGDQGTWEAGVNYNAITYTGNVIDSLYTPNGSHPSLNPGLTPYGGATFGAAGPITAYTIPQLTATGAMLPVQTGTRRDIIGADFKYILGDWTFSGAFRHEHKEGSMEEAYIGANGGMAFALPIDYDTDRYDATAAYTTRQFQAQLQYTFSHFSDNNNFVTLPYAISNAGLPHQESAAYSTPPSNEAHYVTLMLAANDLIPRTRINLNARVGVEKQDDNFAPNSADPNPTGAPALLAGGGINNLNGTLVGTTADSLNAIATVYQVKVSATSNPFANTDTRVYYGIDGRSVSLNQSKVYVGGTGGENDTLAAGAGNFDFVVPQDWLKQNAGAEVGYRIIPAYNTKLTVGYRLDDVDRSNAQVGHSSTNTGSIAVTSDLGPQVDGKLSFDYANRSGSIDYLGPWGVLAGGPSGQTYSGAYYQAPMTSEAVTARAAYTPMDNLSGSFFVQFKNENYSYSGATPVGNATASTIPIGGVGEGIKQDYALTLGPDVNWRPSKSVNLHFFYTYEQLFFNNLGNGACSDLAQAVTAACAGTAGYFQNKDTTSTHTIGASGEWQVNDKLKLRGEYTFSYGSVMFGEYNGVFVSTATPASYQNVTNYPDINSVMHNVRLTATYELAANTEVAAQVGFTSFHNNDWNDTANSIQGAGTSAISILTPGYNSPNYSVVTLMTGVRFKF